MATGENNRDLTQLEKAAGTKAARNIRRALRAQLATVKDTGQMLQRLSVKPVMRFDALDSLTINATRATFIQHFGFEGIKKNGVAMSLKPLNHFNLAFAKTNALEVLATDIGEIRIEQITSKIKF